MIELPLPLPEERGFFLRCSDTERVLHNLLFTDRCSVDLAEQFRLAEELALWQMRHGFQFHVKMRDGKVIGNTHGLSCDSAKCELEE
jgi:hypothetical protein